MKKLKMNILLFILLITFTISYSQTTDHWETIIDLGDSCRYFVPDSDIGTDWLEKDFNDNAWPIGQSGFGYGDDDDNTILPNGTRVVYLRFEFTVQNISDIAELFLDMDYDDGFVAYLNGTEVARANVQDPISWDMELDNIHEAGIYSGLNPERFVLDEFILTVLDIGDNVLAVEVHNSDASSSDMSSNVFLHAGISTTEIIYGPVSDWFWLPEVYTEFNLPLMIINTNGQDIPDEPRIVADMGLIDNGEGEINSVNDFHNEYSGKISIELRGESSLGFAKKSFSIELQKDDGSNNNVSILGLPEENDFVLYGPYSDKTMIKNVLTYELFSRTGRWAPRTRYIEIIINDDYRGIYVLTEKLKRDKNRVDIDKLTADDTSMPEMSGGYILRRDKKDDLPEEVAWWRSPVEQPFNERMWYQCYDPGYDELTQNQTTYIRDWMRNFDEMMSGSNFGDPENGYKKFIKVKSFIDMMFINEISKGIDNYMFSTYFHKENDEDGGELVAGPPWDYNLGYGNLDYGEGWNAKETYGWCYPQWSRTYWFERLMEDDTYCNRVYNRWTEFRDDIFSDEAVIAIIDSCVNVLGDAIDRNFAKFPTLGYYVWPAVAPYPETYEGEIDNLKTWLIGRLAWMDSQWLNAGIPNLPPTDIYLSNKSIIENQPVGTLIGTLSTKDNDSDEHNYFLSTGDGDDDNTKFTIEDNKLLSNAVFDYQTNNTYSIRIKSEDDSYGSFEKVFEIKIFSLFPAELEKTNTIPTKFELKQNYPNPFNPETMICYSLPKNGFVQLKIYDMQGQEVANLVNEKQARGNYKIAFDASALTSGIYLYRIQSSNFSQTKKFILLQ